jgi:hydrogenase maturation factor
VEVDGGLTVAQAERLVNEIKEEPNVRTIFTDHIYESHIAEIDGVRREANLMFLDEEVGIGDYVVIHAGFAISRIDEQEVLISIFLDDLFQFPTAGRHLQGWHFYFHLGKGLNL